MLALVCTIVFAATAAFAVIAIMLTMQGRKSQISALISEYRSLERDREFLARITTHEAEVHRSFAAPALRRNARRVMKSAEAARRERALRVAA
ncbi:hypothetical protein [Novosphingobium sp. B1]|uniref:hypothetical protein n=1 Tax=Novosphingobium sp. B1 TaxID=1938756 RepID=UPI0009D8D177|nr:hypothetical protein [Novosphingobium sp. B1]SMC47744.1 hypothetical protein SAMN06272759_103134 [Novosphingobium sp. B1]